MTPPRIGQASPKFATGATIPGSASEAWLICDRCGDRERITVRTRFAHCPVCDAPRFSRDGQGRDLVCFSRIDDITTWGQAA